MNIGDQRKAGQSGNAGDQRKAGEAGPAGDPRQAGEATVKAQAKPKRDAKPTKTTD